MSKLADCTTQAADSGTRYDALYAGEDALIAACEALNAVAADQRDGRSPRLASQIRVPSSLAECEQAAAALEMLLAEHCIPE